MKVYLFSTGTIEAPGFVMRHRGSHFFPMVCALIDHPKHGLSLVDAGFGSTQLVRGQFVPELLARPWISLRLHPSQIAKTVLERLDYDPGDVRRIIMTHLHWDHADGLADFPNADVVVHKPEKAHACRLLPAMGYDRFQYFDVKRWRSIDMKRRSCLGFRYSYDLFGDGSLMLVSLPGHSPGHMGVFLPDLPSPTLLSGDAFMEESELDGPAFRPYQWFNTHNHWSRLRTLYKLARARDSLAGLKLLGSHSFAPAGGWSSFPITLHDRPAHSSS